MTEIATAFWHRLDTPGTDAARVSRSGEGFHLQGQSVFKDPRGPAALRYVLELNVDWSTRKGAITGFIGDRVVDTHIVRGEEGWTLNGRSLGMPDVVDLDLGFTPATNMVQLKRVGLAVGQSTAFDVAWIDAGDDNLVRLPQEYSRTTNSDYPYRSPTVHYEETIVLAPNGFAAIYPGLWEQAAL